MKIFLLGYMGSGKTAVGKRLAPLLKMGSVDLDEHLSQKEGMAITDIFGKKGEIYFRKRENEALRELLEAHDGKVISLGGGTPCYGNSLELIKKSGAKTIYLKASLKTLTDRLFKERESRPMIPHLNEKNELEDFVRKHLFERGFYYQQSDMIIDTDGKSIEKITEEILLALG